jgi:hypothetical protein
LLKLQTPRARCGAQATSEIFGIACGDDYARPWRDLGKPQQEHELLAPVYGWFTEGFDTLDLKEAKALLDELAL